MNDQTISITVIAGEERRVLSTFPGEYRNLMVLLYDRLYPGDFGECKGMGRCGTCLVRVIECQDSLPQLDRNEHTTLTKMGVSDPDIRLSCQILVNRSLNGSIIAIV
ncbi:2Fe-2S iron-sulfur cluster-binding protein [Puia dinghuensis]|uniref:2Fe-2S ferredoxin-type domain-containing protein n=1 Tax=Puia dinghuensis TaxID=1792502 RepID=A0A8J2UE48_9BACT|nr:2Fe-2S iron-sulfur cluster-binding protein [Puia dinghuensis]GGB03353.1 hypothetical protein GCM10011511_28290 [Puia dinghuensis]